MKIVTLILLLSYNICALKYQRVVVAKHFLCPSPCSLNSKSNSDEDASTDLTEVYSKWAAEEEELHKQSSITTNDSFDDDGGDLPEYMKKLVGKFENEFSGNAVPVPASKLPTIAIIGRPNTGLHLLNVMVDIICSDFIFSTNQGRARLSINCLTHIRYCVKSFESD